jgi:hypothetical protein
MITVIAAKTYWTFVLCRFVVTRGDEYCFFAGAQGPSLSRLTWRHGSNHPDVETLRFRCEKNRSIRMNCRYLCSLQPKSANQASVAKSKCINAMALCCGGQRSREPCIGNRSETAILRIKRKVVGPRRWFLLIVHRVAMRYLAGVPHNCRGRWRNSDHLVSDRSRSGCLLLPLLIFLCDHNARAGDPSRNLVRSSSSEGSPRGRRYRSRLDVRLRRRPFGTPV